MSYLLLSKIVQNETYTITILRIFVGVEHTECVSENEVLKKSFGPKREELTEC